MKAVGCLLTFLGFWAVAALIIAISDNPAIGWGLLFVAMACVAGLIALRQRKHRQRQQDEAEAPARAEAAKINKLGDAIGQTVAADGHGGYITADGRWKYNGFLGWQQRCLYCGRYVQGPHCQHCGAAVRPTL
jgi:membrane protein implicated in regulation of membrane protease activity